MAGPGWLAWIFAAVMLAVAVYCAARLVSAWWWRRPTELDADGVHAAMGVAMAGMLVTGLRTLPRGAWTAAFGGMVAWFAWQTVRGRRGVAASPWRCPHPLPHVVESAAMLYMLLVLRDPARGGAGPGPAVAGMGAPGPAGRFSVLALGLAVFTVGYVVWLGDRLTMPTGDPAAHGPVSHRPVSHGPAASVLAPRAAACCKIAMGVTMSYMLIMLV